MNRLFINACLVACLLSRTAGAQDKIEFNAPDIYPEGITWDKAANVFYVSGVRYATVGKLTPAGNYTELFRDSSLKSTYGMKLDPTGKKLWVCAGDANYSKYTDPATHKKMIRLICIDLQSGKKIQDINLSNLLPGMHFANDLTFDKAGNIYVSDSFSPAIYKIDPAGKASLFVNNPLLGSENIGLNGLVYHGGGYLLVVNSGAGAVFKVDIANPNNIRRVKINQFFPGADGLLLTDANTLTLVQNQSVNKIFRLVSTDNWASARVTMFTKGDALFQQPSTATLKDNETWIMNSKLNELADSMHLPAQQFSVQKAVFVAAE